VSSIVLTEAELARVRSQLETFPWYRAILEGFRERVEELIERSPAIPVAKGRAFFESCPNDHARLSFDPYQPTVHRCLKCGREWTGEEYDLAWVRQFQEWLGKRLVEAGILYRLEGDERMAALVRDSLEHFVRHYRDYPLANNLLGPTRLFQSTYLEAFWLVDVVAAYDLTRGSSAYTAADHVAVRELLYESCSVIRSYDEGVSNRQAFNNAGMGAVALLFVDQELLDHVLVGPHGFEFHMRESLLEDGIWYEGENYHFATLDHTLNLAEMARRRGIDLYRGEGGRGSLRPMFEGPLKVMLPDLTFPSRKDAWFGRGMDFHKEVYELGFARYGDERYGGLLAHGYANGADRTTLGWRSFLNLEPELPLLPEERLRAASSERMPGTGVAVLRSDAGRTYASIEYGHYGGGHGHPDRLHLSLFTDGVQWLLDPGTGWYHVAELGWYRSTLAHNTVSVDGQLQAPREGTLVAFGEAAGLQVAQARVAGIATGVNARRTLVLADGFLLDVLDVAGEEEHRYDWSLHTPAELVAEAGAAGSAATGAEAGSAPAHGAAQPLHVLGDCDAPRGENQLGGREGYEFLACVEPLPGGSIDVTARADGATMRIVQLAGAQGFAARAPGLPMREDRPLSTLVARGNGRRTRFVTGYFWADGQAQATLSEESDDTLRVDYRGSSFRVQIDDSPGAAVSVHGAAGSGARPGDELGAGPDLIAWFGCREARLGGVSLASHVPLAAAALVREGSDGRWRATLPERFGSLELGGIDAREVVGLPEGSRWRAGPPLTITQAPGTLLWRESAEPVTLYAGCENTLSFQIGSYGETLAQSGLARPTLELPSDWRELSLEQEATGVWRAAVALPPMTGQATGELRARAGEASLEIPYRIAAPLSTSWRVDSEAGEPGVTLEVRDERGEGGSVGVALSAPWLAGSGTPTTVQLTPGGRASVRLPLPARQPEASPQESGGANDRAWRLPGLDKSAGDFAVQARLTMADFVGTSSARLPLHWSLPDEERDSSVPVRLAQAEQALWADRRWRDETDASAQGSVTWSERGLRLECVVRDNLHVSDASEADIFENDSLQVYFDLRRDHHADRNFAPGVAAFVLAPSAGKDAVRVRPIAGNREISNRGARAGWFTAEGVEADCEPTTDGYRLTAFFPFESLGSAPLAAGDVIGFDLSLSDNDGTWYRNTQLLWSGARGRRCYIRGSYHDPREFGWLIVGR
jgi:hypothetical protein